MGEIRPVQTHTCAHPSCNRQCPITMLACRDHWYQLPTKLRRRIWSRWRDRLSNPDNVNAVGEHARAVQEAVNFWSAAEQDNEAPA